MCNDSDLDVVFDWLSLEWYGMAMMYVSVMCFDGFTLHSALVTGVSGDLLGQRIGQ